MIQSKYFFIIFVFWLNIGFTHIGSAQGNHEEILLDISSIQQALRSSIHDQQIAVFITSPIKVPFEQSTSLTSIAVKANTIHEAQLWIRKTGQKEDWSDWELIEKFHEKPQKEKDFVSKLMFLKNGESSIQIKIIALNSSVELSDKLTFSFFRPEKLKSSFSVSKNQSDCSCHSPSYINRAGWGCPDGQNPSCSFPVNTDVSHLIIHHSAGINQAEDWRAIVLSIWDFHVRTNNWCDIGYNWLIDPNGVLYQGRGGQGDIRGAHFCGSNSRTMGVCLLGNFEIAEPTEAALNTLDSLLSWKSCEKKLSPNSNQFHASSGKMLPVIAGHKDGCGTICPGANLYPLLPTIRDETQSLLDECNNITHLDNISSASMMNVYPNPSNGHFYLEYQSSTPTQLNIRIFNLLGQEIFSITKKISLGRQRFPLNLKGFPAKTYLLRVSTEEGMTNSSFLRIN